MTESDIFSGTRFDGDGRTKIEACLASAPGRPMAVTKSQARTLIRRALKTGSSQHSEAGATLWVVVEFCQAQALRHTVCAHWVGNQLIGYSVELPDHKP